MDDQEFYKGAGRELSLIARPKGYDRASSLQKQFSQES